jgi:hypothetical protein
MAQSGSRNGCSIPSEHDDVQAHGTANLNNHPKINQFPVLAPTATLSTG